MVQIRLAVPGLGGLFFVFSDQLTEAGVIKWPPPLKY